MTIHRKVVVPMNKKAIYKYYYIHIIKSALTAITCLYLSKFDDIRQFICIIGFLSSAMTVTWIRDLLKARKAIKNGLEDEYLSILNKDEG